MMKTFLWYFKLVSCDIKEKLRDHELKLDNIRPKKKSQSNWILTENQNSFWLLSRSWHLQLL